jgi:HEAT repeat protein
MYARFGLEGIPDPAVDDALRAAAAKLQGRQLVGVLNSIGQRKDAKAVDLLKGYIANADATVAGAAAGALGRIGTLEAAKVLTPAIAANSPAKRAIADSCMACAEGLAAAGKNAEAIALYQAVGKADLPKYLKIAALKGQLRVMQADGLDLLLAQLRSTDSDFFGLGLAIARGIPGDNATTALIAEAKKLPAERQALLILALGDRKEVGGLVAFLRDGTKSEAACVRDASLKVLARIGDASVGDILLAAALGDGEVAAAAKESLKTFSGGETDKAIVDKFGSADAKAKLTLLELIGARRIAAAAPLVRQSLSDADEGVRIAAVTAMGQLVELKDFGLLTGRALPNEAEVLAAKAAMKTAALRMSDRDACAAMLAACMANSSLADQIYILELLGKVSGPKALEIVVANVKSGNPAIKDAASRVLGAWVNADAAPALLEIVKTDQDGKFQTRALRGYIRIARQLQLPAETKQAMYQTAMEVAKRDDEKRLAVDILTRIPSTATLQMAVSLLGTPALKDAAGDAAVKIAAKVIATDPKAVAEAMEKVVDAGVGGKPGDRAKQLLGQAKAAVK